MKILKWIKEKYKYKLIKLVNGCKQWLNFRSLFFCIFALMLYLKNNPVGVDKTINDINETVYNALGWADEKLQVGPS